MSNQLSPVTESIKVVKYIFQQGSHTSRYSDKGYFGLDEALPVAQDAFEEGDHEYKDVWIESSEDSGSVDRTFSKIMHQDYGIDTTPKDGAAWMEQANENPENAKFRLNGSMTNTCVPSESEVQNFVDDYFEDAEIGMPTAKSMKDF